jgi:MFS family permease
MKRGFYTIMSAQFFSSLADNALFVAAVQLLRSRKGPEWQQAALVPMFALFYVILAPFVGAFADSMPKGRVMLISNFIKVVGCLLMLFGTHPLMSYAIVGLGAAAYSPAKYGILTELLPASQLVKANGWIEGLTIGSIILGVLLGGQLVGQAIAPLLLGLRLPVDRYRHRHATRGRHQRADLRLPAGGLVQHPHSRIPASKCGRCPRIASLIAGFLDLQHPAVARQAGPDLAGRDHADLGCRRQPALHRAGLGRGGAGVFGHTGLGACRVWWPSAWRWAPWWRR